MTADCRLPDHGDARFFHETCPYACDVTLKPNATLQARDIAGTRHERTLCRVALQALVRTESVQGEHSPVHQHRCAGIGPRGRGCSGSCRQAAGGGAAMWSSNVASASGAVMCRLWLASISK